MLPDRDRDKERGYPGPVTEGHTVNENKVKTEMKKLSCYFSTGKFDRFITSTLFTKGL